MSTKVTLPYDPVWAPLDWAKKHCPSYITNAVNDSMSHQPSSLAYDSVFFQYRPDLQQYIDYFFSDEHDAMIFKLRWS